MLVVANLSRFPQYVELDLAEMEGDTPMELLGQGEFPKIEKTPYLLTLGPHAFFWFAIRHPAVPRVDTIAAPGAQAGREAQLPSLTVRGDWDAIFDGPARRGLEKLLPGFFATRRWFGGKARSVRAASLWDVIPIRTNGSQSRVAFVLVRLEYSDGEPEGYLVPLAFGDEQQIRANPSLGPSTILARLEVDNAGAHTSGILYDAFGEEDLSRLLLEMITSRRRFRGEKGVLAGQPSRAFRRMRLRAAEPLPVSVMKAEQSNSTLLFGDQFLLKLFRRLQEGVNPELEIGAFLTDVVAFPHAPPLAGAIEYIMPGHACQLIVTSTTLPSRHLATIKHQDYSAAMVHQVPWFTLTGIYGDNRREMATEVSPNGG